MGYLDGVRLSRTIVILLCFLVPLGIVTGIRHIHNTQPIARTTSASTSQTSPRSHSSSTTSGDLSSSTLLGARIPGTTSTTLALAEIRVLPALIAAAECDGAVTQSPWTSQGPLSSVAIENIGLSTSIFLLTAAGNSQTTVFSQSVVEIKVDPPSILRVQAPPGRSVAFKICTNTIR